MLEVQGQELIQAVQALLVAYMGARVSKSDGVVEILSDTGERVVLKPPAYEREHQQLPRGSEGKARTFFEGYARPTHSG